MTAWRWLVFMLCALALGLTLNEAFVPAGDTGIAAHRAPGRTDIDLRVTPGSVAYAEGLRTGDRLNYRALTPLQRFQAFNLIDAPQERVIYRTFDPDGNRKTFVVVARKLDRSVIAYALAIAGHLWFIAFALLVALKRPQDAKARILALFLLSQVIGAGFSNAATPWPAVNLVNLLLNSAVYPLSTALLATYASLFARPLSWLRITVTTLVYLFVGAGLVSVIGMLFWADLPGYNVAIIGWFQVGQSSLAVVCAILALTAASGDERQRLAWSVLPLSFLVGFTPWVVTSTVLWALLEFVTPLLLTYALMSRRVLDLGFALNRAAIFSGVSVVLVGIFVLVEWLLGDWLKNASHTTNIVVAAVLALGLGLSIRFVHARVETFLDAYLFRKRYDDERALVEFAEEAPYITDFEILIAQTKRIVAQHTGASFVTLALWDGSGFFGSVDENDRAIVALRARNKILDLHAIESKVEGEFAYPMVARGRLVGVLVVGPKSSYESYAPDELAAVAEVARSVGSALDGMHDNGTGFPNALIDRLELLAERMEAISTRLTGHANST